MIATTSSMVSAPATDGPYEARLAAACAAVDVASLSAQYQERGGVVLLPPFLPKDVVADMVAEARRLAPSANRARVPFVRTAGAVSHATIADEAPALSALRASPAFISLCRDIVGQDLVHRHSADPHASALYCYARAGDHVGWHRDDCGCVPNASFTVVLGLVEDCTSRLEFDLHRDDPSRPTERLVVATPPGALVLFCGSKAWHRVTPLNRGGERITFSFVFLKRGHDPKGVRHVLQAGIDTVLYFGVGSLVRRIAARGHDGWVRRRQR